MSVLDDKILVPDIYFWIEYDITEKPILMTAVFTYNSKKFGPLQYGQSFEVKDDWSKTSFDSYKRKLLGILVETLDVLIHHGDRILDSDGNILANRVNDAEAERFYLDKKWKDRIDAFHKIVKVKLINFAKAKELKLT